MRTRAASAASGRHNTRWKRRLALIAGRRPAMSPPNNRASLRGVGAYWGPWCPATTYHELEAASRPWSTVRLLSTKPRGLCSNTGGPERLRLLNNHLSDGLSSNVSKACVHSIDFRGRGAAKPIRQTGSYWLYCDNSMDALAVLYLAAGASNSHKPRHMATNWSIQGRHDHGGLITGGLAKNPVFVQTVADAMHVPGTARGGGGGHAWPAAVLGATGAGKFEDVETAMAAMTRPGSTIKPTRSSGFPRRQRSYQAFIESVGGAEELRLMGAV